MRILIIGAGSAGKNLASKLCEEKHDVVLIDTKSEALEEVSTQLDVLTIQGEGSSPTVLESAHIDKADLVVAVTNSDEVNILACMYAKAAGVKYKVARVSKSDYIHGSSRLNLREVGVDLLVSEKEECSNEMFNVLRMPGALEVVDMLDGRVLVVGMKVHMDSPMLRAPLKTFPQPELLAKTRFIAIMRGSELLIPHGDTQLMIGDDVYLVGRPADLTGFLAWAWPESSKFQKVIIAGGSDLGLLLAQKLEALEMAVVLVERDEDRAQFCSGLLNKTLVIKGDALNEETLDNCGIAENTAFAAATREDEKNVIGCLLAGKHGASFTLAQISKPQYVPVINKLSLLDRAVSPYLSMVNAILHFVRGRNVHSATILHNLPGELLEVVAPAKSKWTGKAIKKLHMPEGIIIATVMRNNEVNVATGEWIIEEGDQLVIYSAPGHVGKLEALFKK